MAAVPTPLSIYGQKPPVDETPSLLTQSHSSLLDHAAKLPDEKRAGWERAKMTCPELVTEDHLTMFLRCELFNVEVRSSVCNVGEVR